jgi:hypothetical protein
VVRSAAALDPGDQLLTRLADGVFTSRVESTGSSQPAQLKSVKKLKG